MNTIKLIELEYELNELNIRSKFWDLTELEIQRLDQIVNELNIEFRIGFIESSKVH